MLYFAALPSANDYTPLICEMRPLSIVELAIKQFISLSTENY